MAITRSYTNEREARLRRMVEEFRVAKKRQLMRRGTTLGSRTEAQHSLALIRNLGRTSNSGPP